ncbi:unnamed protein product [Mytilus coruscus]|uniref:MEGF10_11 n=1 Tax=Mytilus coruscus TaxID=42192 RepID=A0A6J8ETA4_MYTCO|nr:unnamed protein product [Mytilus coruscus]
MQTYVFMVLIEECDIGYTSSKGEPCEPCSGNRYGYRCADKCLLCTANQRHAHNETIQHPTENRIESIYEEIDDIILPDPDSNINVELSSNDSTSSDKNSISNSEDQYLNPYQIIVQNIEDRPYSFIGRSETEITNNSDTIARLERYNKESDERKKKNLRKVPLENKFHSLNYPEILFIKRTDTGNIDKYKNTRTFSKQSKSNPCSQDNTEYVEIVHIV